MSKRNQGRLLMAMPILLLALVVTALPTNASAAELVACEVLQSDDSVRIEITTSGEWTHRSFRVEDPERFVLDLLGVEVGKVAPRVAAEGRFVNAVRTSQYRGGADPVTRIVLDLSPGTHVNVETGAQGLALVAFGNVHHLEVRDVDAEICGEDEHFGGGAGSVGNRDPHLCEALGVHHPARQVRPSVPGAIESIA